MAKDLAGELIDLLGGDRVRSGESISKVYDSDAYGVDRNPASVVVLPESTEQVQNVVRYCVQRGIPFTPRGAGTGLAGGAMAALGGVIISLKRMTRILEVDVANRRLHAQAGIPNLQISHAVREHRLHFAPDPSSQSVSTLGGNIAENSGGPHTLKYGVTAPHILGLTIVDPNGDVVKLGGRATGAPGPDLVGLNVGSEGTLGIVTEAWVNLTPLPEAVHTALAAFPTIRDATECVSAIIASGAVPAALEMMDRNILVALRAAFNLDYPEGTMALLLVECDGAPEPSRREMDAVIEACHGHHALDVKLAADEAERAKLWTARKKGVGAMGRLAPSVVTHDGVIPRSQLPAMLDYVYEVAERHQIGVANLFHAGDGNLHPCFYFDDRDPAQVRAVVAAGEEVIRRCVELGGSVTGEHGVGVEKLDLMRLMFTPEDLHLQQLTKRVFNDGALCNPCKVLPDQKGCVEHMRRWRGAAT